MISERAAMTEPTKPEPTLTPVERIVVLVFAVIGFAVGEYLRRTAGREGVEAAAIYGGLATVGGMMVGFGVVRLRRG